MVVMRPWLNDIINLLVVVLCLVGYGEERRGEERSGVGGE
jgi:hypothetical protein